MLTQMATGKHLTKDLIVDRVFDLADTSRCSLFIRVNEAGFQFCVHDPERDALVAVGQENHSHPAKAQEALDGFLKNEFRKGTIAYHSSKAMLIPTELEAEGDKCLSINFGEELAMESFSVIDEIDLGFIAAKQDVELSAWLEAFPFLQVQCAQVVNIELMARKHKFSKGWNTYVDCHGTFIDIYVWQGSSLHMYSSFATKGPNDILYHVANVCQQLEIQMETSLINFTGAISYGDALDQLLKQYIPKYSISPGLQHVKLALGLSSVRKHHFASLFNQASCGL
jgi:hypothetical protein